MVIRGCSLWDEGGGCVVEMEVAVVGAVLSSAPPLATNESRNYFDASDSCKGHKNKHVTDCTHPLPPFKR